MKINIEESTAKTKNDPCEPKPLNIYGKTFKAVPAITLVNNEKMHTNKLLSLNGVNSVQKHKDTIMGPQLIVTENTIKKNKVTYVFSATVLKRTKYKYIDNVNKNVTPMLDAPNNRVRRFKSLLRNTPIYVPNTVTPSIISIPWYAVDSFPVIFLKISIA